jgi:hypothetical protein
MVTGLGLKTLLDSCDLLERLNEKALVAGGNVVERPMGSESTESDARLAPEGYG